MKFKKYHLGCDFVLKPSKTSKTDKGIKLDVCVCECEMKHNPHLHWESPARNVDHWAAVEVVGELVAVDRGAHEDQLQVRSPHNNIFQDGEQEVGLHTALVDLSRWRGGVEIQITTDFSARFLDSPTHDTFN